jgi:hypothetical protein
VQADTVINNVVILSQDRTLRGGVGIRGGKTIEAWRTLALNGAELVFLPACVSAWEPVSAASTGEMFVAELRTGTQRRE